LENDLNIVEEKEKTIEIIIKPFDNQWKFSKQLIHNMQFKPAPISTFFDEFSK
jgi:hypothetical protein